MVPAEPINALGEASINGLTAQTWDDAEPMKSWASSRLNLSVWNQSQVQLHNRLHRCIRSDSLPIRAASIQVIRRLGEDRREFMADLAEFQNDSNQDIRRAVSRVLYEIRHR